MTKVIIVCLIITATLTAVAFEYKKELPQFKTKETWFFPKEEVKVILANHVNQKAGSNVSIIIKQDGITLTIVK